MVGLFLLLRVFCVCPQPDVSEKISITIIKNYRVRPTRIFPPLEPAARFPALGDSFTSPHARL